MSEVPLYGPTIVLRGSGPFDERGNPVVHEWPASYLALATPTFKGPTLSPVSCGFVRKRVSISKLW